MANYDYPGVYMQEIPSGVRTITGVATSVTAFVGRARRGPINEPVTINNFGDYERIFGGLWTESAMGYAVRDFYLNGGSRAIIVRLYHPMQSEEQRDQVLQTAVTFANEIAALTDVDNSSDATVGGIKTAVTGKQSKYTAPPYSQAEVTAVGTVSAYVNRTPPVTTCALVKEAARQKTQTYQSNTLEKAAAIRVANAACVAAAPTGACPDDVAEAARLEANDIAAEGSNAKEAAQTVATAAKDAADALEAAAAAAGEDSPAEEALAAAAGEAAWTAAHGFDGTVESPYANRVANAASPTAGDPPPDPVAAARTEVQAISAEIDAQISAAQEVAKAAIDLALENVRALGEAALKATQFVAPLPNARLACGLLGLEAVSPGVWGNSIRARVDYDTKRPPSFASYDDVADCDLFNLTVRDGETGAIEVFRNVTVKASPRRVDKVLEMDSKLVRVCGELIQVPEKSDEPTAGDSPWDDNHSEGVNAEASDGEPLDANDFMQGDKKGLYALEKADLFNLLCIPPYNADQNVDTTLIGVAAAYCEKRRAMLILDSPSEWGDKEKAKSGVDQIGTQSKNAALFFPRFKQSNPLHDGQIETFSTCGAVAGIFSRTDATRGVWKAPAGLDASLVGVLGLTVPLTDPENGELNPLAINCLRTMPGAGHVVWGARTLQGNDRLASEWKYIPVRRTALFIEESLYRGTQWIVFEPNDEPLWAQIRLNIGAFMNNLFRQGAFQGKTSREAYFVKCDKETTTPNDINLGIVNIEVGFAPLKPAEFVVIKLQQMAGQIQV